MFQKMTRFAVVAGLVLALASAGPAAPIPPASYSYSIAPISHAAHYLDDTGSDLTDGLFVNTAVGSNPPDESVGWQEWTGTEITFDLGGTFNLADVTIGYVGIPTSAMWGPYEVTLTFSTDGVLFGSPIVDNGFTQLAPGTSSTYLRDDLVVPTLVTASHVKVAFDGGLLESTGNSNGWLLDEISFDGTPIPEPTTFVLAALGLLALLGLTRRRK